MQGFKLKEKYILVPENDNCVELCIHKCGWFIIWSKSQQLPKDYKRLYFDTEKQARKFMKKQKLEGLKIQKMWLI